MHFALRHGRGKIRREEKEIQSVSIQTGSLADSRTIWDNGFRNLGRNELGRVFRDGAADRSLHEEEEPSALSASSPALAQKACWCLLPPGFYRHLCISSPAPLFSSCPFEYFPVRFSFSPFLPPPPPCLLKVVKKCLGGNMQKLFAFYVSERRGEEGMEGVTFGNGAFLCLPFSPHSSIFFLAGKKKKSHPPQAKDSPNFYHALYAG